MKLIIAEKPSMARAIAEAIGQKSSDKSSITCQNDFVITWCFGHLYEQASPDYYTGNKFWKKEELPIIPSQWQLIPKEDCKAQIAVIKKLLASADLVINAGDPDREGQLLVDEVLEELNCRKTVQRLILMDLSKATILKAVDNMQSNTNYQNMKNSALARARLDWLFGMNLTRAFTLNYKAKGGDKVISYGRVQTPTLALIVNRDLTIKNFVPKDFFKVQLQLEHEQGTFTANLVLAKDFKGLDSEGYLTDKNIVQKIIAEANNAKARISVAEYKQKEQKPTLPYSLSELQKEASKLFGMSAQKVLDTAQALYEKKLISYPRTDCRYLPEEAYSASKELLEHLVSLGLLNSEKLDFSRKSEAWNNSKLSAHHALMPVLNKASNLSEAEEQIYKLICKTYLAQFMPNMQYDEIKIIVDAAHYEWSSSAKKILSLGWRELIQEAEEQAEEAISKGLKAGDTVQVLKAEAKSAKTSPPAAYTEGTLITAMTNIAKMLDEPELKKILKDSAGLGTEATRAGIIETLKKRGYIETKGKNLLSTSLGQEFIKLIPQALKSPGMTALWEQKLSEIEQGELSLESFLAYQVQELPKEVELALSTEFSNISSSLSSKTNTPSKKCKYCGGEMKKFKSKKNNKMYWGCFNPDHPENDKNKPKFIAI